MLKRTDNGGPETDLPAPARPCPARRARRSDRRWHPVLNLGLAGSLSEDWIPEVDIRLSLYTQLAHIEHAATLDVFEVELEDRFGPMPPAAGLLLATARTGMFACAAGIRPIDVGPGAIALTPRDAKAPPPGPLQQVKDRWLARERIGDPADRLARVGEMLDMLVG